jgi:uncharacterized cupredoxin-like copper-binding protein
MKKLVVFFGMMLVGIALVACGGGEPAAPESVSVVVEGTDALQFSPTSLSVPAGSKVDLTFKNVGGVDHNFMVVPNDADPLTVTESSAIAGIKTETISGLTDANITFTAPPAGTYKYVCTTPGHAAAGMVGTLTVTP